MDKRFVALFILSFARGLEGKFPPKTAEDEIMMVAFKCGQPNVYLADGLWKRDKGFVCPKNNNEILNYCRHVYPDAVIDNIMEAAWERVVPAWCPEGDPACRESFDGVVPYKCLAGKFQNEALLVPGPCIFDHLHDSTQCTSARGWAEMAGKSCKGRGLVVHKSSMLKPCGLNKFTGVEFVCCPISFEGGYVAVSARPDSNNNSNNNNNNNNSKTSWEHTRKENEWSNGRARIVEAYKNRDREGATRGDGGDDGDTIVSEHDFYLKAKKDLARHHKQKVTDMINEWNSARARAIQTEEVNKKEGEKMKKQISERFQKLYEAEEVENEMEKKQLSDLHQQRVTADLNDRKQKALDHYRSAIDEAKPEVGQIAKALKHLIKVMHKDRLHTVNRFKHLLDTDPAKADAIRESSANHISGLDKQLEEAVSLLDRVPKFKDKIHRLVAGHLDSYRSVDASVFVSAEEESKDTPGEGSQDSKPSKAADDDYVLDVSDSDHRMYSDDDYLKVTDDEGKKKDEEEEEEEDEHEEEGGAKNYASQKTGGKPGGKGFFKIDPEEVKKFKHGEGADSQELDPATKDEPKKQSSTENGAQQSTGPPGRDRQQVVNLGGATAADKQKDGQTDTSSDEDEDRSEDLRETEAVSSIDGDIYDRHFFHSPDHMHKNDLGVEQLPKYMKKNPNAVQGPNFGAAIPLGVAVGTLTVAVVIAIGVLVMRRRGAGGLYHTPPADAAAGAPQSSSPEERHVANMQINGYENPTYKYFERYQQSPGEA